MNHDTPQQSDPNRENTASVSDQATGDITANTYVPYVAPEDHSEEAERSRSILSLPIRPLTLTAPFQWLIQGARDFGRAPWLGLYFGFFFFLMGHALWWVFQSAPAYALALSAGFLLMGPFICLGLYYVSKKLELGEPPLFSEAIFAWTPSFGAMAIFAGVLLVLEMLWGRASLIVFAVAFDGALDPNLGTLAQILRPENIGFLMTYFVVGAVFANLIYAASVIAIPMIMDRQCDAVSAGLTSFRACLRNPLVMLLWAALIAVLSVTAMLPYFLGMIVIIPIIGHATWHAYRAIVAPV